MKTTTTKSTVKRKSEVKLLDPMDYALPYQKRWALDESRWKFGLMARQVGKDFSAALGRGAGYPGL